jgi:hypothetical protein
MLGHVLRASERGNGATAISLALLALALTTAGCTSNGPGANAQGPNATFQTVREPATIAAICQAEFQAVLKDDFGDPQFSDAPEVQSQTGSATVTGSVLLTPVDASADPSEYTYTCTMVPNPSAAPSGWAIPTLQLTNKETGVTRKIHEDYPAPSPATS